MEKKRIYVLITVLAVMFSFSAYADNFIQVGDGEENCSLPCYVAWNYTWSSMIFVSEDLGDAKTISKLAFNQTNANPVTLENQKIYLKHTTDAEFPNMNYEDPENNGYTLVYDGTCAWTQGWFEIDITDFQYNGTDNLILHWENSSGTETYNVSFQGTGFTGNMAKLSGSDGPGIPTATGWPPYPTTLPNTRVYYAGSGPSNPTNPNPADNALNVPVEKDLSFDLEADAETYDIYLGTSPENLTLIAEDETASAGTNTFVLDDFDYGTQYYWQAAAKAGGETTFSSVWNFETEYLISDFPYTQGFESETFPPAGWSLENDGTSAYENWEKAAYPHSGSYCAKANYNHTSAYLNLVTPIFEIPENCRISFWWKDADSHSDDKVQGHDTTYFEISIDDGATWTALDFLSEPSYMSDYAQAMIYLTDYAGENAVLRWRDVTDASISSYGVLLDDILIEEVGGSGEISLNITDYDFGEIAVGGTGNVTVEISNLGIGSLTITGADVDAPFSCSYTGTIPSEGTAQAVIYFNPETDGTFTDELEFLISGDYTGDNTISLTGTAIDLISSFVESFEGSTELPEGWTTFIDSEDSFSDVTVMNSPGDAHSGTNSAKMMRGSDSMATVILVTPGVTGFADNELSFWIKNSWSGQVHDFVVGYMTDPADGSTFTEVQTFTIESDEYQKLSMVFSESAGPYIAFKHGTIAEFSAMYIDDISWEETGVETPPNPAVLVAPENAGTDILVENIHAEWTSGGGSPEGYKFYAGTDNPPTNIVNGEDLGEQLFYELPTPLDYSTQYFWKVVPYNQYGDAEDCPVWSFTTMADPTFIVTAANPFIENFDEYEANEMPLGWSVENTNGDFVNWTSIMNNANSPDLAHSAPTAMHIMFNPVIAMDDWLFTVPLVLQSGKTYKLSYWYKVAVVAGGTSDHEKLEVKVGDANTSTAMLTQIIDNNNMQNTSYMEASSEFTVDSDGVFYVGFHGYSDPNGNLIIIDDIKVEETTAIEGNIIPESFSVHQNYPNPFNPETVISYALPKEGNVSVEVYNIVGQKVKTLVNEFQSAGIKQVIWNGTDENNNSVVNGVYFYTVRFGNEKETRKMLLLK